MLRDEKNDCNHFLRLFLIQGLPPLPGSLVYGYHVSFYGYCAITSSVCSLCRGAPIAKQSGVRLSRVLLGLLCYAVRGTIAITSPVRFLYRGSPHCQAVWSAATMCLASAIVLRGEGNDCNHFLCLFNLQGLPPLPSSLVYGYHVSC